MEDGPTGQTGELVPELAAPESCSGQGHVIILREYCSVNKSKSIYVAVLWTQILNCIKSFQVCMKVRCLFSYLIWFIHLEFKFSLSYRPAFGGRYCKGKSEEWKICETAECAEPIDLRALQCNLLSYLVQLDKRKSTLTWLPIEPNKST